MKGHFFKKFRLPVIFIATTLWCTVNAQTVSTPASPSNKPLKIAVVNFKTCVEKSKMGKQEQANFESLKKQMESVLEEKEKALNDMGTKFNDPDYLDSLSAEAETEMKRKFRAQSQELSGYQNQYMQILQQTNLKVIQKLTDATTNAASRYAKENHIDLVLNEDSFFYSPDLDISQQIIKLLDVQFDKEEKEAAEKKETAPKI